MEGQPTRLVFLAACNTAAQPDDENSPAQADSVLLQSFAETLTRQANLPAIVAMQYFMSDMQANKLTAQFFATIAVFDPVDVALAEARKATMAEGHVGRDVLAPVMYLQAEDGNLFRRARNWPARVLAIFLFLALIGVGLLVYFGQRESIKNSAIELAEQSQEAFSDGNPVRAL